MKVRERNFHVGRAIFVEGDVSTEAYLIKSGRVDIVRRNRGQRVILQHLESGDIFGEMGLLLGAERTADAIVREDFTCIVIGQDDLDGMLRESPRFIRALLKTLSIRLKMMNDRI
jgi:CRP/FNR family cyclic AMP-dependent transcriptional regulator